MRRRDFLFGAISAVPVLLPRSALAVQDFGAAVLRIEAEIEERRSTRTSTSTSWVIEQIVALDPRLARVATFELTRRVPYKLTAWTGDPDSLFNLGRGDCRHKEAACRRLLRGLATEARHVQVLFDWADLPIPPDILGLLTETRGFHDAVEATIGGQVVLVDATWDPALKAAGFPVLDAWDGVSATTPITQGELVTFRPSDIPKGSNPYDHFGVAWPTRKRTLEFNRAFNAWSDTFRA